MSVFDPTTDQAPDQESQSENNQGSFLERLVNAKGEAWKDPEMIAKGKLEADAYIEQQKSRIAELEARVAKEEYSKSLLERLQNNKPSEPAPASVDTNDRQAEDHTSLDAESIRKLIADELQEQRTASKAQQNLASVESSLTERFGSDANKVVAQKAVEYGVSVDFLASMAAQAPKAFLNLVGEAAPSEAGHSVPSKVNSGSGFNNAGERNFHYYNEMRRTNPQQYRLPETWRQMQKDCAALGERWKT